MKKIFTLLLVAGALTTASAQTKQEESRRVILGKPGSTTEKKSTDPRDVVLGREDNHETRSEKVEQKVEQVNRKYDSKILEVRNNPNLSADEKERRIRQLESERQRKIREIRNDERKYDDDDYDDKKKKDKKYGKNNNGKKLGWEKGVGNPHRTGSDKEYGKNKGDENRENKKAKKAKGKKG